MTNTFPCFKIIIEDTVRGTTQHDMVNHWIPAVPGNPWYKVFAGKPEGGVEITLDMGSANKRRRYIVTSSLIGFAHTQNNPCGMLCFALAV